MSVIQKHTGKAPYFNARKTIPPCQVTVCSLLSTAEQQPSTKRTEGKADLNQTPPHQQKNTSVPETGLTKPSDPPTNIPKKTVA